MQGCCATVDHKQYKQYPPTIVRRKSKRHNPDLWLGYDGMKTKTLLFIPSWPIDPDPELADPLPSASIRLAIGILCGRVLLFEFFRGICFLSFYFSSVFRYCLSMYCRVPSWVAGVRMLCLLYPVRWHGIAWSTYSLYRITM